ncbi:MAG: sce7726 family protein [Candidatus Margulisbacteria bacterium]|nr:sce7726 family protein [Candidatus Margulisiibacteriota bacterium]
MGIRKGKVGAANIIKAELIDFLLKNGNYDLLASETPFFQGNRWADLIALRENKTIGFEIKSEQDSLRTLKEQLSDYIRVFNMVYLVLSEKFINNPAVDFVSKDIGLIIIKKDHKVIMKRKATPRLLLDKKWLITLLWRKDLEKLCPKKKNTEMDDLKNHVLEKCSVKNIQKQIIISLKSRYATSYKFFLKDRGNYTTIEDLRIITRLKKNHVF